MSPIDLSSLNEFDHPAVSALRTSLRRHGFAVVNVTDTELLTGLEDALAEAQTLDGFRFPPNDESPAIYTAARRSGFRSLFRIAVSVFSALLHELESPLPLRKALEEIRCDIPALFGIDGEGHEPFEGVTSFAQSFFNLFNYDSGLLNPHCDRSLLTVVKVSPGQSNAPQSALWVKNCDGDWTNADNAAAENAVLIMIGEDCEAIPAINNLGLYGAEHAVRVDPAGDYLAHSHFRPDPATPQAGNRRSAAFILRHDP